MCGIAGILRLDGGAIAPAALRAMADALAHRGPDDRGYMGWAPGAPVACSRDPGAVDGARVAFAHRRLSILDLSPAGRQPMASADGRLQLAFNGEIYNYLELRAELAGLGHTFRSDSDTEVLLAAYRQWGAEALPRLVGMFAFALLDVEARRVLFARDPFGIKPLYYAALPGGWAFASEMPALLALPEVSRRAHPQAVYAYLRSGLTDHGSETLFAGIRQLEAGHALIMPLDGREPAGPTPYWRLDTGRTCALSFAEAAEQLRALFLENVRLHLRSDVPVGAALSGGIDSSAIVCAMRHLEPAAELHAFSFIPTDPRLSEAPWIDQVVTAVGATAHMVSPTSADLVATLESLIRAQGAPFGSTSIYAQHRVFEEARRAGIPVMLDGQGADELFGGYVYFAAARLASLIRQGRHAQAAALVRWACRRPGVSAHGLVMRAMDFLTPPGLQEPLRRLVGREQRPAWLNARWFAERHASASAHHYASGREVLKEALAQALTVSSLPHLLRYEDRSSMAHAIESRVPFLTPGLANFVMSLPEAYLIAPDGTSKAVFRAAMRGLVPDAVLDRQDKIGFNTPEQAWMRQLRPWVQRVLTSEPAREVPALDLAQVQADWAAVLAGKRPYDSRVWRWVNLIEWKRQFDVEFA